MKTKKEKLLLFIGYSLFALFAFVLFFLMTLPFNILEEKGLRLLEGKTGCVVTIKASKVSFPLSVDWRGLDGICPKNLFIKGASGNIHLKLPALEMSFAFWPLLLKQEGEIDFNAKWGGGTLSGHLSVSEEAEGLSFSLENFNAKALQVEHIDSGISGQLRISGEGRWRTQDLIKGVGRISLTLDGSKFKSLAGQSLPIGEVGFEKIEAKLLWKEKQIILEQFSALGPLVNLKSESGTLLFRKPLKRSVLALSLRVTPKGSIKQMASMFVPGYNGKEPLKLRLNGPVSTPKISVNGRVIR